jgi:hypothetical protein
MKRQRAIVPFVKGLQKGDLEPQLIGDGSLMKAENVVVTERGRVEKRKGFTALSGSKANKWLGTRKNRPVLYGDTVDVKDESGIRSGAMDEVEARAGVVSMSSEVIWAKYDNDVMMPEVAYQGNYRVTAYVTNGGGNEFELHDRYSEQEIETHGPASTDTPARLVPLSNQNRIYAIYVNSGEKISVLPIDTSGAGDIESGSITSMSAWPTVDVAAPIDAVKVDDDILMLVYKEKAADKYVVGRMTMAGVTPTAAYVQSGVIADIKYVTLCKWTTAQALIVFATEAAVRQIRGSVYNTSLSVIVGDDQIASFSDDVCGQIASRCCGRATSLSLGQAFPTASRAATVRCGASRSSIQTAASSLGSTSATVPRAS